MSDFARLDKGFASWQGQRIFVPWIGGPRIVQSAESEVRVRKVRFWLRIAMAMAFLPLAVVAGWTGSFYLSFDVFLGICFGVLSALSVTYGVAWMIERLSIRNWPILTTSRFGRSQLMIGYLRSRSPLKRADELLWGLSASFFCVGSLLMMVLRVSENFVDVGLPLRLVCILLGTGLMSFLSARHAVVVLLSLIPISRKRLAQETSHGF